jgi:hypothetical protein
MLVGRGSPTDRSLKKDVLRHLFSSRKRQTDKAEIEETERAPPPPPQALNNDGIMKKWMVVLYLLLLVTSIFKADVVCMITEQSN